MKCSPGISNFLEEISSLSHSVLFLYFFALISEEGFLISPCYSLELYVQIGIPFLFSFAFHFSSLVRPPQTAIFLSCISFPWGWSWSLSPIQCHEPLSIVFQVLCLSDLIPWIYFSLSLYNHKWFDLGHSWMVLWFSLLQFKSEFSSKEFMIWATVSSQSCFCWLYRASPSLAENTIFHWKY